MTLKFNGRIHSVHNGNIQYGFSNRNTLVHNKQLRSKSPSSIRRDQHRQCEWMSSTGTSLPSNVHINSNRDNCIDASIYNVYHMNSMQDSGIKSTSHNVLPST